MESIERWESGARHLDHREAGRDAGQDQPRRVQSGRQQLLGQAATPPGRLGQPQSRPPAGAMGGVPLAPRLRLLVFGDELEEGGGVQLPDHSRSARSSWSTSALAARPSSASGEGFPPQAGLLDPARGDQGAAPRCSEGALRTATNRPLTDIHTVLPRATRRGAAEACRCSSRTSIVSISGNGSIELAGQTGRSTARCSRLPPGRFWLRARLWPGSRAFCLRQAASRAPGNRGISKEVNRAHPEPQPPVPGAGQGIKGRHRPLPAGTDQRGRSAPPSRRPPPGAPPSGAPPGGGCRSWA